LRTFPIEQQWQSLFLSPLVAAVVVVSLVSPWSIHMETECLEKIKLYGNIELEQFSPGIL
jgi:hypothetical protein